MEKLEKEIRDRLQNARSTDGIDPERLWANIADGLPPAPADRRKQRRAGLMLLAVLLLASLAAGGYFLTRSSDQSGSEAAVGVSPTTSPTTLSHAESEGFAQKTERGKQSENIATPVSTPPPREGDEHMKVAASPYFLEKGGQSNTSNRVPPPLGGGVHVGAATGFLPTPLPQVKDLPTGRFASETLTSEDGHFRSDVPASGADLFLKKEPTDGSSSPVFSEKKGQLPPIQPLPSAAPMTVERQATEANRPLPVLPGQPVAAAEDFLKKPLREKKWAVAASAGGLWFDQKFSGTADLPGLAQKLNQAHSPELGAVFSMEIRRKIGRNGHVGIGLGWAEAQSRFDFVGHWDTVMHRDNVPGAPLVRARATRTVEHHNRAGLLRVPLSVGLSRPVGRRFAAGLEAGAGLHFLLSQKGRTLDGAGRVAGFDGRGGRPVPGFFAAAFVRPFVEARAGNGLSVWLGPALHAQPVARPGLHGLQVRGTVVELAVGAVRRF